MGYRMITKDGSDFFHCTSAMQKCIRRGMEHEALYYATELYISGYEEYCWSRFLIIASEDIGLANPQLIQQVKALHDSFIFLKKRKNDHKPERLAFIHAALLLVRSQKSRLVDNKLCYYYDLRESIAKPEFPDFIFDMHTREGKRKGRGEDHFYSEAGLIKNVPKDMEKEEYEYRDFIWNFYKMTQKDGD